MAAQVTVGKPTGGVTGVEVGTPTITDPGAALPSVEVGTPVIDAEGTVAFHEFYAATQGDADKANQLVPGVATREGVMLLRQGPDGKPRIKLNGPAGQAAFLEMHGEHRTGQKERSAAAEPEWIRPEEFTPAATRAGFKTKEEVFQYFGPDTTPFVQGPAKAGDSPMVRNPNHPATRKLVEELRARQAATVQRDEAIKAMPAPAAKKSVEEEDAARMRAYGEKLKAAKKEPK